MDLQDALFTSDRPIDVTLEVNEHQGRRGSERWLDFHIWGVSICRRPARSPIDEENAKWVFQSPVILQVAAAEDHDGSIAIALLAQVCAEGESVFTPAYPGVRAISTAVSRFFPLGDLLIDPMERRAPGDLQAEVRALLADLFPVTFTSDTDRSIDALLGSV